MTPVHKPRIWIALAMAGAVGFIFLAWLKSSEWGQAMDTSLLLMLQSVGDDARPLGPAWMREAGRDLTALGSISVLLVSTLAVVGWLMLQRMWLGALLALVAIAGGTALSFALKMLFSQPRPDLLSEPTEVFTSSFPSSHAMASLVTFYTLAWVVGRGLPSAALQRYLLASAIVVSLISGFSRLYLGVHWPSDVLAGWLAGIVWLCLCAAVLGAFRPDWFTARHTDTPA